MRALREKYPSRIYHYSFDCGLANVRGKEETQRTRAFLFGSIAFALAHRLTLDSFFAYKNGVTSINFLRRQDLINGRASRTTHPQTHALMADFLSELHGGPMKIVNPFSQGFYLALDVQHQTAGMLDPEWFVDDWARFLGVDYYVGGLSAVAVQGAAHQRPVAFQVFMPRNMRAVSTGGFRVEAFPPGAALGNSLAISALALPDGAGRGLASFSGAQKVRLRRTPLFPPSRSTRCPPLPRDPGVAGSPAVMPHLEVSIRLWHPSALPEVAAGSWQFGGQWWQLAGTGARARQAGHCKLRTADCQLNYRYLSTNTRGVRTSMPT